jgi:hypothetical protein
VDSRIVLDDGRNSALGSHPSVFLAQRICGPHSLLRKSALLVGIQAQARFRESISPEPAHLARDRRFDEVSPVHELLLIDYSIDLGQELGSDFDDDSLFHHASTVQRT